MTKIAVSQEVLPPVIVRDGSSATAQELRAEMERIWRRGITNTDAALCVAAWFYVGSKEEARAIRKGEIERMADDYLIKRVNGRMLNPRRLIVSRA